MHHIFTSGLPKVAFATLVLLSACSYCQPFDLSEEKEGQAQSHTCHSKAQTRSVASWSSKWEQWLDSRGRRGARSSCTANRLRSSALQDSCFPPALDQDCHRSPRRKERDSRAIESAKWTKCSQVALLMLENRADGVCHSPDTPQMLLLH